MPVIFRLSPHTWPLQGSQSSNPGAATAAPRRFLLTVGLYHWARYYAALLPRRGRILRRTLSVRLSVCLSVPLLSVTSRHLANYNDTHVLYGTRRGPHIVRPSRPHKFLLDQRWRKATASEARL